MHLIGGFVTWFIDPLLVASPATSPLKESVVLHATYFRRINAVVGGINVARHDIVVSSATTGFYGPSDALPRRERVAPKPVVTLDRLILGSSGSFTQRYVKRHGLGSPFRPEVLALLAGRCVPKTVSRAYIGTRVSGHS